MHLMFSGERVIESRVERVEKGCIGNELVKECAKIIRNSKHHLLKINKSHYIVILQKA